MIDLSKDAFILKEPSITGVSTRLKEELPVRAQLTIKKNNEIRVREGLWRGASLVIDDTGGELKLVRILHQIPSLVGKTVIFVASALIYSVIMMIAIALSTGRFIPVIFVMGGAAGFATYTIVERILVARIRNTWAPELYQAIERLNTRVSGIGTPSLPFIRKRPIGVTVVGWFLIVISAIRFLIILVPKNVFSTIIHNASAGIMPVGFGVFQDLYGLRPHFFLMPFNYFGIIVFEYAFPIMTCLIGIFLLAGSGWFRWIYIGLGALGVIEAFGTRYFIPPGFIVIRVAIYISFAAVLLRKDSSAFFAGGKGANS